MTVNLTEFLYEAQEKGQLNLLLTSLGEAGEVSLISSECFIESPELRTLLGINNEKIFVGTKRS